VRELGAEQEGEDRRSRGDTIVACITGAGWDSGCTASPVRPPSTRLVRSVRHEGRTKWRSAVLALWRMQTRRDELNNGLSSEVLCSRKPISLLMRALVGPPSPLGARWTTCFNDGVSVCCRLEGSSCCSVLRTKKRRVEPSILAQLLDWLAFNPSGRRLD